MTNGMCFGQTTRTILIEKQKEEVAVAEKEKQEEEETNDMKKKTQ